MSSSKHGSARFSDYQGADYSLACNGFNAVFGRGSIDSDLWHSHKLSKHFLSVAPTRSGKGAALIIPNLLIYQGSAIVIDPKGENAYVTAERRRRYGQKTHILDPWGEVNRRYGSKSGFMEEIATFNPLSILDPSSEHFADDIAYISDAVIINQGKDPHWDNSARELVAGLIAFAVIKYKEAASLPLVRLLLTKPPEEIAGIAKEAQEFGYSNVAARKLGRFVGESKELGSIISTALTQTAFLDSETLGKNMEESSFSFEDVLTGKATIYLVLPVDKLQTYGRWLRLMISIGIRTIARNTQQLRLPVLFFLDEFGTIGKLSAVSQAVGLMAGLQMCIWIFVQDFIQLKRDYPDEWETFIANAAMISCFNVMDQFTAEYLSRMLGNETVEKISQATAEKRKGGFFGGGDPNYMAMADQEFSRPLMAPDEIRRMREDLGLLISNRNPSFFQKTYYFKEPHLYKIARPDPSFPNPAEKYKEIHKRVVARLTDLEKKIKEVYEEEPPVFVCDGLKKINALAEDWKYESAEAEIALLGKKVLAHQGAKIAAGAVKDLAGKGFSALKGRFFK